MIKKLSLLFLICILSALNINAAVYSGSCGENVNYSLDTSTGLLSITGTGAMEDYIDSSFIPWYKLNSNVKVVEITEGVTSIGRLAFGDCSGLTSIEIPNSVTSIGDYAFGGCSGLTSITIPNSVTSIGNGVFYGCYFEKKDFINNSSLDAKANNYWGATIVDSRKDGFVIKDGTLLKYTGNDASITIPNSVTSIGSRAFQSCSGLTSITISNSVTSIGEDAFSFCRGLTSVTIPNSVTSIGESAFYNCSGLTSVIIPNSVKSIGSSAFENCSKLTSITIPNSVTSIGNRVFYGCYFEKKDFINNSSLDAEANNYWGATIVDSRKDGFVIKDGTLLKYTGNDASITIPNSVTSIGESAFGGCSGLTSVVIPNTVTSIGSWAFQYCSGLTSVIIPNSVTSIGNYAFYNCSGLTSVTIPNSVTSIGSRAFDGADIPTVISLIENPFTIEGKTSYYRTFTQNTFNNATLYVPKGTIEKYKATDGWKDFLFIEEGEGPGGDTPEIQKCSTPTISYVDGKLTFDCETEGVEYVSSITPPSAFNSGSKTVSMPTTYKVTVYATKDGYENSDVATKDINVSGGTSGLRGDVNNDGTVSMPDAMFIVNKILNGKFPDE